MCFLVVSFWAFFFRAVNQLLPGALCVLFPAAYLPGVSVPVEGSRPDPVYLIPGFYVSAVSAGCVSAAAFPVHQTSYKLIFR